MGQDATETLSEIEAARQRLERDVVVLEDRLGNGLRDQARRTAGVVAVTGAGLLVATGLVRRRLHRRTEHRRAHIQAEAVADVLRARDRGSTRHAREIADASVEDQASMALLVSLAALAASVAQFATRRRRAR